MGRDNQLKNTYLINIQRLNRFLNTLHFISNSCVGVSGSNSFLYKKNFFSKHIIHYIQHCYFFSSFTVFFQSNSIISVFVKFEIFFGDSKILLPLPLYPPYFFCHFLVSKFKWE